MSTTSYYDIKMDDFSSIKVSTQTFIIHSNLDCVDLSRLQEAVSLDVAYEDISDDEDEDGIEFPRIIAVSYKGKERGKQKKRKKEVSSSEKCKNFLNCVSFTTQNDPKKNINVKLFNNGVFQLTGCKCYTHAQKALVSVWKVIKQTEETSPGIFKFKDADKGFSTTHMEAYVVSAMRNVDFRLGFEIDREVLGNHIMNNTDYKIVPIIQGFMGVQLSVPIESVADMVIHKISFQNEDDFTDEKIRYDAFWEVKPSEKVKAQKGKSVTIAVFQTGKVLISGIDAMYQEPVFLWFINEIKSIQDSIIIKKEPPKTFSEFLPKKRRSKFQFKTVFQES